MGDSEITVYANEGQSYWLDKPTQPTAVTLSLREYVASFESYRHSKEKSNNNNNNNNNEEGNPLIPYLKDWDIRRR